MEIQSYRDLEAWQLGMEFVVHIYQITDAFPQTERFGLTSQLRRAAVAIPSNIAEGHQHKTTAYRHFVVIALGSLAEVETQIELAQRLKFATTADTSTVRALAQRVRRVLHGLRRSLQHGPRT